MPDVREPSTSVLPTPTTDLGDELWFNSRWRPAMAWQYLVVCVFDFIVAPILMGLYSAMTGEFHQWEPLTLKGGGLYHLSMGAVVGVAVWSRGREKMMLLNNVVNGNDQGDGSTPDTK